LQDVGGGAWGWDEEVSGGDVYLIGLLIGLSLGGFVGYRIGVGLARGIELNELCAARCAPERSIAREDMMCFCDTKRVELGK
jgi:hypothetical protein